MKKLFKKLKKALVPRKKSVKKPKKKAVRAVKKKATKKKEDVLGVVTHFYGHIKVAVLRVKKPFRAGVKIKFRGATTDFEQTVASLQYNHKPIALAPKGKQVGMKVKARVREGDIVYRAQ
ncbi:MAG: hypothetical protein AAB495_03215 [Patescibacteria group bacterium]